MKPVWIVLVAIALTLGTGLGAMLGSVNLNQGTTLAVVTAMGAILGSGWLSRRFLGWIKQHRPERWESAAVRTGFMLGAINLAIAMVIGPVALWRVVWSQQQWPWMWLGCGLGFIGAACGGLLAVKSVTSEH
ncbi:MAG: hypothetical protein ACFCU8_11215 [Thermosynechococcaceae cyanobacterium]